MHFTNKNDLSLVMAAWLAYDDYDNHNPPENEISVTTLLKPIRQIILGMRVPDDISSSDVSEMADSRIGQAIHSAIEQVWLDPVKREQALHALGIPKRVRQLIKVNPDPSELEEDDIPIYLENRTRKEINGFVVSGKYDVVNDGSVEDNKSYKVYSHIKGTSDEEFILQMSIYRWLNPNIITEDISGINYIFKDYRGYEANYTKNYPPSQTFTKKFTLMPLVDIERWISDKLDQIRKYVSADQKDLPLCTEKELWSDPPTYKYYKNPENTKRSTANFDNYEEAQIRLIKDGSVGKVVTVLDKAKKCNFCSGAPICDQRKELIAAGRL